MKACISLSSRFNYIQAFSFWMVLPKFWMALHPLDNPPWKCPGASQSSQVNSPINHHLLLDSNMTVTSHLPQVKTETYRRTYQLYMARLLPNSPPSDLILCHYIPGSFILPRWSSKAGWTSSSRLPPASPFFQISLSPTPLPTSCFSSRPPSQWRPLCLMKSGNSSASQLSWPSCSARLSAEQWLPSNRLSNLHLSPWILSICWMIRANSPGIGICLFCL